MLRVTKARTTILAALAAASCVLSFSPAALAGHSGGRDNADRRHHHGKPGTHQPAPEQRRAKPGGHESRPQGRDGASGRADERRAEGRTRRNPHDGQGVCCASSGAGTLKIEGCAVRIGNDHKYKKIANAFKKAGYHAYVRTDCGVTSVRVYGFPAFDWTPCAFNTHTTRNGNVLEIRLCRTNG